MTNDDKSIINDITEAVSDKKGRKTIVIDLSDNESAPARALVVCQGNSTAQVGAIADYVRDRMIELHGMKPVHYEGYRNCQWVVIDYGFITVHVFLPDTRQFYSLETLWNDALAEEIPDLD